MFYDIWTPVRLLIRMVGVLLLLPALALVLLSINRIGRRVRVAGISLEEFMISRWSLCLCRVFGVRVRPRGAVAEAPALLVANHVSWLDIQALHGVAAMSFVGKAEISRWPVLGFVARAGGTIFIERGNHASSTDAYSALSERLLSGGRVAVFPEGGIRPGDGVKLFHARLFKTAVETECAIQPVMVRYIRDGVRDPDMTFINQENMLRNMIRLLGRPLSEADLHFLPLFLPADLSRRELARRAQKAVTVAYEAAP